MVAVRLLIVKSSAGVCRDSCRFPQKASFRTLPTVFTYIRHCLLSPHALSHVNPGADRFGRRLRISATDKAPFRRSFLQNSTNPANLILAYQVMPLGEALDDDYVASLLKRDAEANKSRYLTSGLGSLLSGVKPRSKDAPKPNTRFLRNIVREVDSHNAALKAKEEEESRSRLRELKRDERGSKRRREDGRDGEMDGKRRKQGDRPGRWASALGGLDGASDKRRSRHDSRRKDEGEEKSRHREHRRRDRSREDRHRHRHRHPEPHVPRSPSHTLSPDHRTKRRRRSSAASDSDPLNEVIGPAPPPKVRPRGRGAFNPTSTSIDTRFRPDYDPKADVNFDPSEDGGDDWDMALEALRDRTKWRQQGAERLKAAGFTDEEVAGWEKGKASADGREKDVDDVRWRKKGESREWDRGKVLDEAGGVALKAEWAR